MIDFEGPSGFYETSIDANVANKFCRIAISSSFCKKASAATLRNRLNGGAAPKCQRSQGRVVDCLGHNPGAGALRLCENRRTRAPRSSKNRYAVAVCKSVHRRAAATCNC